MLPDPVGHDASGKGIGRIDDPIGKAGPPEMPARIVAHFQNALQNPGGAGQNDVTRILRTSTMQYARNLWLDETAHETRTRTLLGKFVGQVGYFLHCIRNNLVAIAQLPEFVDGSDRFPSPVGQLDMHYELIEVELVLLLKIIGLVVIFPVGADAQPSDFDRRIEGKLQPRVLFLFLEVACLPTLRSELSVNDSANRKTSSLLGKGNIRLDCGPKGFVSQVNALARKAKNLDPSKPT